MLRDIWCFENEVISDIRTVKQWFVLLQEEDRVYRQDDANDTRRDHDKHKDGRSRSGGA
jgi:hypothetical protein